MTLTREDIAHHISRIVNATDPFTVKPHAEAVLKAFDALRAELAQCQRERDEARMSLDNRQQEVDRLILEQSHTYAVEIPELEQQLAQCQRERDALRGELQQSYKIVGGYDKPITQAIQGKLAQARRMVWEECIEYWSKECSLFGPVVAWCREQSAKEQP